MSSTVAAKLGPALVRTLLPRLAVLEPTAIVLWRSGVSQGARVLYVVRNSGSRLQQSAAGVGIYAADWLVGGDRDPDARGGDVQEGDVLVGIDILTGDTRAFVLTGEPDTDQGLLLGPCGPTPIPSEAL